MSPTGLQIPAIICIFAKDEKDGAQDPNWEVSRRRILLISQLIIFCSSRCSSPPPPPPSNISYPELKVDGEHPRLIESSQNWQTAGAQISRR